MGFPGMLVGAVSDGIMLVFRDGPPVQVRQPIVRGITVAMTGHVTARAVPDECRENEAMNGHPPLP